MKIKKYFDNRLELVKNLEKVCEVALKTIHGHDTAVRRERFSFQVDLKDGGIEYDNYDEFIESQKDIDLDMLDGFSLGVYFRKGQEDILKLWAFSNRFAEDFLIEITSSKINLIEEIFRTFLGGPLIRCKLYKYNPNLEDRKEKEAIIRKCIKILENFNSLQIRSVKTIDDEKELQRFIFPILKSHFDELDDEFHLPKFGSIEYVPDFGIQKAELLIEAKYLRKKQDFKKIQKEVIDDAVGYLKASGQYKYLIVFIYNSKNFPYSEKYKKDIKKIKGIKEIIIVPGVTPK